MTTLDEFQIPSSGDQHNSFQMEQQLSARGRQNCISYDQLYYLLCNGFSAVDIASMLGTSLRTIRRRMSEFGLSRGMFYNKPTQQVLDAIVYDICQMFPNIGYRRLMGELLRRGVGVTRSLARES